MSSRSELFQPGLKAFQYYWDTPAVRSALNSAFQTAGTTFKQESKWVTFL